MGAEMTDTIVDALKRAKVMVNDPYDYDRIGAAGALDLATRYDKQLRIRAYNAVRSTPGPTNWADYHAAHDRLERAISKARDQ